MMRTNLSRWNIIQSICADAIILLTLIITGTSYAADFTANSLGDYGNVTVMEVSGNYDAPNLSGPPEETLPRQIIAREFFKTHKDEYDFLVIFTNFDFQMPDNESRAFYKGVKNDTQGIGRDIFDNTQAYGSGGWLQGAIDMGNVAKMATDPLDPKFEDTLGVLSHEMMHRWAAYVKFKDETGAISPALLGHDGAHWSFLLDSGGSVMYGNRWQDNGNGTFTSTSPMGQMKLYSPLDLYLMGMIDKSKVPTMLLIHNPDVDDAQFPLAGTTVSGTAQYVTIDQIIAAMGPRVPDASISQKNFKSAFILITRPGTFTGKELAGIENIRNSEITRLSILTDGAAIMQVASTLQDNLPVNPGVVPPSMTPRNLPPNISDGVAWLMTNQRSDGSWADLNQTAERDTTETMLILGSFSEALANHQYALQWLGGTSSGNMDFLARKIVTLAGSGMDTTALVNDVLSRQNTDGGWGSDKNYASNPADTALAMNALSAAGISNQQTTASAIAYVKSQQNPDGGWGIEDMGSMVQQTSNVLSAINKFRTVYPLDDAISRGTTWLVARQNIDGGFGNSPSTVYDTSAAALTLVELNAPADVTARAIAYLQSQQSDNGSWNQSPYQTALAVRAVYKATVDPDLSVKPEDIAFIPASITSLPTNVMISATIRNQGRAGVPHAKVALYEGDPASGNKINEQTLSFAGQASTMVTFSVPISKNNVQFFTIVADPDNLVTESNKLNNRAAKALSFDPTYDLQVTPSDISVSANPVDLFQDLKITAKITNNGTMNVYNVQVKYSIDDPVAPFEIASQTVDIPAGGSITREVIWRTNKAGLDMPLSVIVDPFNTFTELSKTNNKASIPITVHADARPNLTISYKDILIDPAPANKGGSATIAALVRNEGFSGASNIVVDFSVGVPGQDGVLIGSQTIPSLDSGESASISILWQNIPVQDQRIIYVQVDPAGQISEITRADNIAFTTLVIRDLPDLVISPNAIDVSPAAPKEGDTVTIIATVQNRGAQTASNVAIQFAESGAVIGVKTIPDISPNKTAVAVLSYDTTGKKGPHTISVTVDPDNLIAEQSKDNNSASHTFGVQDANLWVTEAFISPNGDGIKDNTQFFFKFDVPRTVVVHVVNKRGEAVRTFNGLELENCAAGSVTWDGLNSSGMVVPDGVYQMTVRDPNGKTLASLPVVVDVNRSPLSDAVGTKYLLNSNLSCPLPLLDDTAWTWFPDDSGILLLMPFDPTTPEYPYGLYTLAPDGQDISRIVPLAWSAGIDPDYNYYYAGFAVSPDSENIAFILNKYNRNSDINELRQLWVMDRYGRKLSLFDSYDDASETTILDLSWSPRGEYLAYRTQKTGSPENLWIVKPDEAGRSVLIDSGNFFDIKYVKWSPDKRQLAYVFSDFNFYDQRIKVAGIDGSTRDVYLINDFTWPQVDTFEWLMSGKLVLKEKYYDGGRQYDSIRLVDASGNNNHRNISPRVMSSDFFIAPDKRSFAFVESEWPWGVDKATITTKTCDTDGNTATRNELHSVGRHCIPQQSGIVWSPDSKKIAFSNQVASSVEYQVPCENPVEPSADIIDVETGIESRYGTDVQPFAWFADGLTLAGFGAGGQCSLNADTGETRCMRMPPGSQMSYDTSKYLSPGQHFLTYYQEIDTSSVCYRGGFKYSDLWSVSSLLNLTADLRAVRNRSAVTLKGIASDLNFDGYQLEYADVKNPTNWSPVAPPSDVPVINDIFTTWVPPYEGSFSVRLKARDKAGNVSESRRSVSWGLASCITNLYKTLDVISPNGDGVKDAVELHYRVLEPVHLEFNIYDDSKALVKTYYRDYSSPADDLIAWDGTDDTGNVVPDGKYGIKVFEYEFFVEVDNTPPDARIAFSPVTLDRQNRPVVTLFGHAFDKNIKNWSVEFGQGDNPDAWTPFLQGNETLAARDVNGTVPSPTQDAIVQSLTEDLGSLRGKKARITARDYGGNVVTSESAFIDERIFLVSDSLYTQGSHMLKRAVTTAYPIVEMVLQKNSGGQWIDAAAMQDPDLSFSEFVLGNIDFSSDPSGLRLKGVDVYGHEYVSNDIPTAQTFSLSTGCGAGSVMVSLLEDLTSLKLQVKGATSRQWTDLKIYSGSELEKLLLKDHGFLYPSTAYVVRIAALGKSGRIYTSAPVVPSCSSSGTGFGGFGDGVVGGGLSGQLVSTLTVSYGQGDCGHPLSGTASLSARTWISDSALRSLRYYLDTAQDAVLLKSIDLTSESSADASANATSLPTGRYPVRAVWEYYDAGYDMLQEITASSEIVVDHIPPNVQLTYPAGNSLKLCPIMTHSSQGEQHSIPIEAVVSDNTGSVRYELYFGYGENPDQWSPAAGLTAGRIAGIEAVTGSIGSWDISGQPAGTYTFKLKAIDVAGNVNCTTATFSYDAPVEIINLVTDNKLISSNTAAIVNTAAVNYEIDKYATVDALVSRLVWTGNGYFPEAASVQELATGLHHFGGIAEVEWKGSDSGGAESPDGLYGVAVHAVDGCGNSARKWVAVEIDTTPPVVAITFPKPGDALGNIIEVKGAAMDAHFRKYLLEVSSGETASWSLVSTKNSPISNDILGRWNASGLEGEWTLRLTAFDAVGNKNEATSSITLAKRTTLINDFDILPNIFAPRSNGRLGAATIQYVLTDRCDVTIGIVDANGVVRRTFMAAAVPAGAQRQPWDGTDDSGVILGDGSYTVRLIAVQSNMPDVNQVESITATIDATSPEVDVSQPMDNSYVRNNITVTGSIKDAHLSDYAIAIHGPGGTILVEQGTQIRDDHAFGILNDLPDGDYTLNVKATDLGGNETEKNIAFTVDKTAPVVTIDASKNDGYYGGNNPAVDITGSIDEQNIGLFTLRFGLGDPPLQWTELAAGSAVPGEQPMSSWKVGPTDGVPDGVYSLSLLVTDKSGLSAEAKSKITVDNTAPIVSITAPGDSSVIRTASDVTGTAFDLNLDTYTVDFSEGQCSDAYQWSPIKASTASVASAVLANWLALPSDGAYCLRATAVDKSGNTARDFVNVTVDTHPPAPPVISGTILNKINASLTWTGSDVTGLSGYNVYRNGLKINNERIVDTAYLDQHLTEGLYAYTVTAVDVYGSESMPSNEAVFKLDLTGPNARVSSPLDGSRVSGLVDIKGTAYSPDDFKQYRVSIGQGAAPSSWTLIRTSPLSVSYGTLAQWDTLGLADGQVYSIKLEAEDMSGNVTLSQIVMTIDNAPPAAPRLISATTNSADVALTWQTDIAPDITGYLVYRNDQLANVSGIVIGDMQPYLITGTTYFDNGLSDGTFRYYLIAVDKAGNMSDQSNTLEVTIDTHPPHATIIDPMDTSIFGGKIMVKAESPDLDIASVQFQYQSARGAAWTELGSPATNASMVTYLDPIALGLVYGDYRLRAMATDKGQKTDPSPGFVTITYTDLTPPAAPQGLIASTNGGMAALTWAANAEKDLAGYNVYRTVGGTRAMINSSLITTSPQPSYQDRGLEDGNYLYDVTAVDTHNNESKQSGQATAQVYAPVIKQPYTPTGQSTIQVLGTNAAAGATVSLFTTTASGLISLGTATVSSSGAFTLHAALAPGENRLSARVMDSAGNISKDSADVVVVFDVAPSRPTGAEAFVGGSDVHLTWDPNPEPSALGYNIYRDGVKVNKTDAVAVSHATISASSSLDWYSYAPAMAIDSSLTSCWMPQSGASTDNPAWWEMDLSAPELIRHAEIHWGSDVDSSGDQVLYAGRDYEVQFWSGYAWITQVKVTGNTLQDNLFDFEPAYRTGRIRVLITDSTDGNGAKQVRLAEVNIVKDNLVSYIAYDDLNLINKGYGYAITAVDNYGFESQPSYTVTALVNVTLPATPALSASVLNSDVTLNWTTSPGTGTTGYNVYRNTGQGWDKIGALPVSTTFYLDEQLLNGTYGYSVTAVDGIGNESVPSNTATVTVAVTMPDQPAVLSVTSMPDGTLTANWVYTGIPPAGFNLYRGLTSGGPYAKVNPAMISGNFYVDTGLTSGMTYFYVVTFVDSVSNEGARSNEASGTSFDASRYPDLSVSSDGVYLYPPCPIAGQQMSVNTVVRNTSRFDVSNVDVVVYIWNALGQLELLTSETITSIPAGSSTLITAMWNSAGKAGFNRLVVVIDPDDTIVESNKINNSTITDFSVVDKAGISMSTAMDYSQYTSNQTVNIAVAEWNAGPLADTVLTTRIVDGNGNTVTAFSPTAVRLAYAASSTRKFTWNTGSIYAGNYTVHTVLKDASGSILAENKVPFTIVSDAAADVTVATDKIAYDPQHIVLTNCESRIGGPIPSFRCSRHRCR